MPTAYCLFPVIGFRFGLIFGCGGRRGLGDGGLLFDLADAVDTQIVDHAVGVGEGLSLDAGSRAALPKTVSQNCT